jgi:hypothetical protein
MHQAEGRRQCICGGRVAGYGGHAAITVRAGTGPGIEEMIEAAGRIELEAIGTRRRHGAVDDRKRWYLDAAERSDDATHVETLQRLAEKAISD